MVDILLIQVISSGDFRLFGDRTMTNEPVAPRQSLRLRYTEAACLKD